MQMFSINAASLLLERDRRTVTKAMFGVPPEGKEKKQPRWKMSTIVDALERHGGSNDGGNTGNGRLADIADELETLQSKLDAAIAKIKTLPSLAAKQPHSRAAARLIERISALYDEGHEIESTERPGSPWPFVTPVIVGHSFRLLLAAVYGPKVDIDGKRLFTDEQIKQFGLAA
jgi:hypothetical protein